MSVIRGLRLCLEFLSIRPFRHFFNVFLGTEGREILKVADVIEWDVM